MTKKAYHFCTGNHLQKHSFRILSQKKRSGGESQQSGFRLDLKNPPGVWILWNHDQFLDFTKKTQNPFLDLEIRIWIPPHPPPPPPFVNFYGFYGQGMIAGEPSSCTQNLMLIWELRVT